jgi:hypothetical protein
VKVRELIECLQLLPNHEVDIELQDTEDANVKFEWVGLEISTVWESSMERGDLSIMESNNEGAKLKVKVRSM